MDYLAIVENLFKENENDFLEMNLVEYFEEIVGYSKNSDNFLTELIIKYMK